VLCVSCEKVQSIYSCQARRCLARRSLTDVGEHLTLGVQRFRPGGDHPLAPAALATVPPSITQPRRAQHSLLRGLWGDLIIPPPSLVRRPIVRAIRTLAAIQSIAITPPVVARACTRNCLVAPRYRYRLHLRRIPTHSPHRTPTPLSLHPIADGRDRAPLYPLTSLAAVVAPQKTGYVGRDGFAARASARKVGRL
jgi:hypothetical protein